MKLRLIATAIASTLIMSGCTVNGTDEFSCPNPEKGVCISAKTAYQFAEDSEKIERFESTQKSSFDDGESDSESEQDFTVKNTLRNIAPVAGTISAPLSQPKPVLEPAKVLRVWINTYEDKNGVLFMPQTSFVEITPRKWALGGKPSDKRHKSSPPFTVVSH